MNEQKDLVLFRLGRADEALDLAIVSVEKKYWNSAASELYYTCFYLINALFANHNIQSSTHSGAKTLFALHFIKKGIIEIKWGRLLQTLFDKRQEGDYGDFMLLEEDEIAPLVEEVQEFKKLIYQLLDQNKNHES